MWRAETRATRFKSASRKAILGGSNVDHPNAADRAVRLSDRGFTRITRRTFGFVSRSIERKARRPRRKLIKHDESRLGLRDPLETQARRRHNTSLNVNPSPIRVRYMKVKTKHRKSYKWRKRADSSPVAKGRRPKRQGRNPSKTKHLGGAGLK